MVQQYACRIISTELCITLRLNTGEIKELTKIIIFRALIISKLDPQLVLRKLPSLFHIAFLRLFVYPVLLGMFVF
jgi:hypothetical protein